MHEAFARTDHRHVLVSMLSAHAIAGVTTLAQAAGFRGSVSEPAGCAPHMEESRRARALWEVAQARRTLKAFPAEKGFRGRQEGEVSSRSWREAPEQALALARSLAA